MELNDRVVLVTGAAHGLGRATSVEFAQQGAAAVAINYRSALSEAEETAEEVTLLGCQALVVQADVRSDSQVRRMIREVDERFGRLDVLVNNAGVTSWVAPSDLESLTDDIWDDIIDVNLKGAFRCARAAASLLKGAGGVIINISSISGMRAVNTSSSLAYGASKAAIVSLTQGLAIALAPLVRVNAVAPAFTDTRWVRSRYGDAFEEVAQEVADTFPLRRIGKPSDIAAAIVALTVGGDFITGQTLMVDGGRSII